MTAMFVTTHAVRRPDARGRPARVFVRICQECECRDPELTAIPRTAYLGVASGGARPGLACDHPNHPVDWQKGGA